MFEKAFVKVMIMIALVIIGLFVVPYLIGAASTLFVVLGVVCLMLGLYAEIKIGMSFFKEKK